MSTAQTRELVMRYWKSWQQPTDLEAMRACLADKCRFEAGPMTFDSADQFLRMIEAGGSPWQDVQLLDSVFADDKGSIIYTGFDTGSKQTIRVAEIVRVEGGKIVSIVGVMSPPPPVP